MDRKEFIDKYQATFIMEFDCINWYYREDRKCKSILPAKVFNFLINEQAGRDDNIYLQVNCSYIENRLGNSRSRIQEALTTLTNDGLIDRRTTIGAGGRTEIKINWAKILEIHNMYLKSPAYSNWHKSKDLNSEIKSVSQIAEDFNKKVLNINS